MSSRKNKSSNGGSGVKRSLQFVSKNDEKTSSQKNEIVDLTEATTATSAANDSTPVKKKAKKDIKDFFGSPAATTTSSARRQVAVVTPPEKLKPAPEEQEEETRTEKQPREQDGYVPIYIHKNVGYVREGESGDDLDPTTRKVFELVDENYVIPKGFETNRKYGPLSGVSFEQRVIACYCNNLLEPKQNEVDICTECADQGHKRDDCPTLI